MNSNMENTLKNVAKVLGLFLLIVSIYLSYDGFDQKVTGGNGNYTGLGKVIGVVIAVTITAIQFIFSSRYEQLNTTLKGAGLVSYAYSIWTNYLGAKHLLGMDDMTAIATAFFMDIVPEPMIAWGLGDALKGDVFGNIGKWFSGNQGKPQHQPSQSNQPKQDNKPFTAPKSQYKPQHKPNTMPFGDRRNAPPSPQASRQPYNEKTYHRVGENHVDGE